MSEGRDGVPSGEGIYFAPADCAGLSRRFLIAAIDYGIIVAVGRALQSLVGSNRSSPAWATGAWIALAFAYFVFLESRSGTVGYLLTGVRILTLKGERPTLLRMAFRYLLWALGPIDPLVDLLWAGGDDQRQTLRDKFSGTLVVKRKAGPVGRGKVRFNRYTMLGWLSLGFYEVDRPPSA